jgi:hypothetical protein
LDATAVSTEPAIALLLLVRGPSAIATGMLTAAANSVAAAVAQNNFVIVDALPVLSWRSEQLAASNVMIGKPDILFSEPKLSSFADVSDF